MPNTASAKKRLRQNESQRARNRAVRSEVRSHIRNVRQAAESGEIEKAEAAYQVAAKRIDKASAKRVIHRNTAARTKSRLQHLIKAAKSDS